MKMILKRPSIIFSKALRYVRILVDAIHIATDVGTVVALATGRLAEPPVRRSTKTLAIVLNPEITIAEISAEILALDIRLTVSFINWEVAVRGIVFVTPKILRPDLQIQEAIDPRSREMSLPPPQGLLNSQSPPFGLPLETLQLVSY